MPNRTVGSTLRTYTKIAGALYLLGIILGIISEVFIRGRITVWGDAAATAANLRSMEQLWRWGIASEMIQVIATTILGLLLYVLLKPVKRDLAQLALFFNLIAITVTAAYSLQLVEALFPLGSAEYLKAFTPEQLNAMVALLLKSHALGFGIALLLFGPFFLLTGYLIFRSGFLPRVLGVLYLIAGTGYLIHSFALILAPEFANLIFPITAVPILIGESSLCLWLLFKGVDTQKWNALASVELIR